MQNEKNIIGLLAHVDAGKTTLSEALLYMSNTTKKLGRVDHNDSLLDYNPLERQRGITIYAKEARFKYKDREYILEDTPGHIDFSLEMERVLPILDYAILLIDASSELKPYTKKLFALLNSYNIPTIIFLNKSDLLYRDIKDVINDLRKELSNNIIDFTSNDYLEDIATFDDDILNEYLNTNTISDESIFKLFKDLKLFPLISGSALKRTNIQRLLDIIDKLCLTKEYPDDFRCYVYRIGNDNKKNQLTYIKVNGGLLNVKDKINDEKVDEIRLYSGTNYLNVSSIKAGDVACLRGINKLLIGEYINDDKKDRAKEMLPYLTYEISSPNTDKQILYKALYDLQKENPLLNLNNKNDRISISLMGNIQREVLKSELKERYDIDVLFSDSMISYKESITRESYGIGHYEPLRHYAEVHLRIRPAYKKGKVITNPNNIKSNYIDVITDYFMNNDLTGILTASPVIDIEIAIMAIDTSLNHTTNEDIRKASAFALRNALLDNECILLEPYENYRIDINNEDVSRLIYEIELMDGTYNINESDKTTISGKLSSSNINKLLKLDLIQRKNIYIERSFFTYEEVFDPFEIISSYNYDPYNDPDNVAGSIFFKNGAGYYVNIDEVFNLAHIKPLIKTDEGTSYTYNRLKIDDAEVKRVFEATSPKSKKKYEAKIKTNETYKSKEIKKERLYIVDGYNVLYTHNEESEYKEDADWLINELASYQKLKGIKVYLVFDAYKVDNPSTKGDDFKVIYTKKDETADYFIQKTVRELKDKYSITVISSDHLIQVAVLSFGAYRMSSRTLLNEFQRMRKPKEIKEKAKNQPLKDLLKDFKVDD